MMGYLAIAGYALLFTTVSGLLRVGYDMPRILSGGMASLVVALAVFVSLAGYLTGLGAMSEVSAYSTVVLIVTVSLVGLVRDGASPA